MDNRYPSSTHLLSIDKSLAAFLALLLFGLYMVTFDGTLHSTDGLSMIAVAENLVKHGRFDTRQLENWENVYLGLDGQPYTLFALGPTLFMAPFLTLALFLSQLGLTQTTMILMPLFSALTAPYLYLSVRRLGYPPKTGLVITLLAGLATMIWPRTRDLVADPLILFSFTAAFYYALAYRQNRKLSQAGLMGLALSLAVLHKTVNVIAVPFFFWYMLGLEIRPGKLFNFKRLDWLALLLAIGTSATGPLITGVYNLVRFGDAFNTGYPFEFTTPAWMGFIGFIISPYKSLFLYTPLFVLIPFNFKETWQKHRDEAVFILALLISQMIAFGAWHDWGGGGTWGPRFLVSLHGLLILLLLPFIDRALQPKPALPQLLLVSFGSLGVAMQILGLSARDNVYLNAGNYWTPPPKFSLWGELRWDQPDQWPIWGHLLQFDWGHIPVIWRWQWANLTHFDPLALLAALLIVALGLGGSLFVYLFRREAGLGAVASWLIAGGSVAIMLVRSYDDPRSIKMEDEAAKLWPSYQALVRQLPQFVSPADAIIFTDRRFEFYLFDTDKSSAQRYIISKPTQPIILETVPKLLQQQAGQGLIWLVTDELDNRQVAYAVELWLRAHGQISGVHIFGDRVRLTAFQLFQSTALWGAIPAQPPLAGLVDPDDYKFKGIAALLGWNWPDLEPGKPLSVQAGLAYRFEFYWIYHGKASQDTFFVRLLNPAGQPVTHVSFPSQPTNPLSVGQMVMEETIVAIPPDLAPGLYHFQLGFSTLAVATGELTFDLPTEMTEIRIVP